MNYFDPLQMLTTVYLRAVKWYLSKYCLSLKGLWLERDVSHRDKPSSGLMVDRFQHFHSRLSEFSCSSQFGLPSLLGLVWVEVRGFCVYWTRRYSEHELAEESIPHSWSQQLFDCFELLELKKKCFLFSPTNIYSYLHSDNVSLWL